MAGGPAKGKLEGAGEVMDKTFELIGRIQCIRPRPAKLGGEPTEGRADQATLGDRFPAPEGTLRDRLLTRAGVGRPLQSRSDALTQQMHHRLQHRADRSAPTPQVGGHDRAGRPPAETDSQDGKVLKDIAGGEICYSLAVAPGMLAGATSRSATRAAEAGFLHQGGDLKIRTADRCTVAAQAGCE